MHLMRTQDYEYYKCHQQWLYKQSAPPWWKSKIKHNVITFQYLYLNFKCGVKINPFLY
jgi:hypothetical protein